MSSCKSSPECPTVSRRCTLPVFQMDCETGFFDLAIEGCESKTDCQIQSQIIMALFAKARDNSRPECNRGGWWGGDIGSRLWTLEDRVISDPDEVVNEAEQILSQAITSQLSGTGITAEPNINASIVDGELVFDCIDIKRPEGTNNYSYLWDRGCS